MFVYGRFLSIRIITVPIIAIATIIAAKTGSKYVSAIEGSSVAVGAYVGTAGSTAIAVTACDGQ
jgi:hypothetical protein